VLAAAAAVVAVLASVTLLDDDADRRVSTTEPGPTSSAPSTTTTVAPEPASPMAVWPPANGDEFTDPVRLVDSFLRGYLVSEAPALSPFRATGPGAGEVDVYLRGEDGEVRRDLVNATVSVVEPDGHWLVAGARSDDIVVTSPQAGATVGRPVVVEGRGRGFEGNMVVEAVALGQGRRDRLAQGVAIAGCCETLEPFRVELDLGAAEVAEGSVVVVNDTGSFVVVPVRFGTTPAPGLSSVDIGLVGPDGTIVRRPRTIARSTGVLRAAVEQLLRGPTAAERDEGLRSALDQAAAAVEFSVTIRDGMAVVDFAAGLPASSPSTSASAASEKFLAQLQVTVFQFPAVARAEYRIDGSCEAFWAWLQRDCTIVER
ncbi:MAG: Gmad2 immunoglobulin-like domain-containing protein, partial [Acidimicrobiales bacterium]